MIPYGKQNISEADIEAVIEVLRSDYITQGPAVPNFEQAVSSYVGSQYAVAANSATSSLHLACLALGVGPGDTVWTTPITFVATANCAHYCGANIDFVDIDPNTYNLSIGNLDKKLKLYSSKGLPLPKVVIAVHLSGNACDMESIHEMSKEYGFKVIEDASHAIGGDYNQQKVGSCKYSDITVFSFHPVKIITTGEGGIACTNCQKLADKMRLLRSHGVTRDVSKMNSEPDGSWYYEQLELGYNYRLTDLQAALGISQLKRIDTMIEKRRHIAEYYNKNLIGIPIKLPTETSASKSSWHLYIIVTKPKDHKSLFEYLKSNSVGVNLHYMPLYRHPYFIERYGEMTMAESDKFYSGAISIPIFFDLSKSDQDKIIKHIRDFYDRV